MSILPFNFKNNTVRVVTGDNGEFWFLAKDVAEILGYSDTEAMTRKLDAEEVQNRQIVGFGNRGVNLINESGLYSAILTSQKPEAKIFKKWVTSEVLPSIRKTGSYKHNPSIPSNYIQALEALIVAEKAKEEAIRTKAEIGCRREATAMNTASQAVKKASSLEIQLDRSKEYCTVKRMSMFYHGQKFDWREVKSASIELQIPPIDTFDANYGTVKAYHIDAWHEAYGIDRRGLL